MDQVSEIKINPFTQKLLPIVPSGELFDPTILPQPTTIVDQMSQPKKEIEAILKENPETTKEKLVEEAGKILPVIRNEIADNEARSRHRTTYENLKSNASQIKVIALITRPGTYLKMNKKEDPAYNRNEMLYGAERLNDDSGAALAIAIAGMQTGILSEEEIKLFLEVDLFTGQDPKLESLKGKVYEALRRSGIRILYTGKPSETKAIKERLYSEKSSYKPFVPLDLVDFLDSNQITNTESQAVLINKHLQKKKIAGQNTLMVTDAVQVSRLGRFLARVNPELSLFHIRPTSTRIPEQYAEYAAGEMRGTYRAIVSGKASLTLPNSRFI